jgi:alcohol dehydrogenase class IV
MGRYENWHQGWCVVDHEDAVAELPAELARLESKRCMLVLPRSLDRSGTLADVIGGHLGGRLVERYTQTVPHVPRESALRLASSLREHSIDTIVALGGGSVVDTAKGARLALLYGCETPHDFDALKRDPRYGSAVRSEGGERVGLVSLPTTLAGAEFTSVVGMVDSARGVKDLYSYDELAPDVVVLDPRLASETPRRLWHATGVKLLSDAIEQTYGRRSHSLVSTLALDGARRIAANIEASCEDDPGRVLDCFRGAWFSMFGVVNAQTFPGIAAALRHQLGAQTGASHGEIAAVLLPHVLRFNLPGCPDVVPRIGSALGAPDGSVATVVEVVEQLLDRLDVPRRLRDLGTAQEDLPRIAQSSVGTFAGRNNPRDANAGQLLDLLHAAF